MIELVSYKTWQKVRNGVESANRVALIRRGKKWVQVLAIDATSSGGLRVWKVPMSDLNFMAPLMRKGKPYPMSRALVTFRRMAKEHGITNGGKKILKEAAREDKERKDAAGEAAATATGDNAEVGAST